LLAPEETGAPRAFAKLPLVELGALAAVGIFALVFHLRSLSFPVPEGDYQKVAEVLKAEAQPGDVVLLYPWWTERARLYVPEGIPVVGFQGSDAEKLITHPRIWLLAQPEKPRADLDELKEVFGPGRTPLAAPRRFGPLELTLYQNGHHRPVLFSATEAFASARVYLETPRGRVDCPFDGRAHRCPQGGKLYVAPEWHEIARAPYRCLWFRPPGGDARLVAEFPEVAGAEQLMLEAGIVGEFSWHTKNLTPLEVGVENAATGQSLTQIKIPPGLEPLQRAEVSRPGAVAPRLWVKSASPELRESCVQLYGFGSSSAATSEAR
jgi:hypothetical protein